jgi:putative ABC transport system ATP-binding protein
VASQPPGGSPEAAVPVSPMASAAPAAANSIAELGREAVAVGVPQDADAMIVCDRLVRIFATDGIEVQALQGLDLVVASGELTAIVGASGSGKSTLMNILAALDVPTAGSVRVAGHDLTALTARERTAYRRWAVGFVWQQSERNLLPYLTGWQNVLMPMQFSAVPRKARGRRAGELLDLFGVTSCAGRTPAMMSGGEQQRVAIATAMANEPAVLLADEPTGELDSETAGIVFDALRTANAELDVTILVVTHDPMLSGKVRRTVAIRDGRTSSEILRGHDGDVADTPAHPVEYALVDRAGRLQLPRDMLDTLGIRERVRLEAEPDHIGVWPDSEEHRQG